MLLSLCIVCIDRHSMVCCRYIYIPLGGSRTGVFRQIVASFSAFAFIWLWHGAHAHTVWWFIPNWIGVVVESIAGIVLKLPSVRRLEVCILRSNEISIKVITSSFFWKRSNSTWKRVSIGRWLLRLMVNIFLLWSREIFLRLTFDRYD